MGIGEFPPVLGHLCCAAHALDIQITDDFKAEFGRKRGDEVPLKGRVDDIRNKV
jgi:hypothetical protein